ncbi:hypothetical protein ABIA71_002631 [Stenotrophomonas sp. 2619]|uniref:hypothetical protein n=1 Tax=Stenotrophomonas sp. 2619 TaxID=3156316 RepID=UPI003399F190
MNHPELRCDHCQAGFVPTGAQAVLFETSRAKGMRLVMLDCPHCHHGTAVNPSQPGAARTADPTPSLPCPERACTGEACWVDTLQPPVWGCGSCGTTWADRAALDAAIATAIARFPWRAHAYVRAGSHYRAAPSLPARYEADVATEWAA